MGKLAHTAQSAIAITFLVLNLEPWLALLLALLFWLYALCLQALNSFMECDEDPNLPIGELTPFASGVMDASRTISDFPVTFQFSA